MKKQIVVVALIMVISTIFTGCIDNGNSCENLKAINANLSSELENLTDNYNNKVDEYNILVDKYNNLTDRYGTFYTLSTLIKNETIYWRFNKTDKSILTWTLDIDLYRYFADWTEFNQTIEIFNSNTGETYNVNNLSLYVQSYFFDDVITDITNGKTDKEFVREVVNIKNQISAYASGLGDHYHWSAETLTHGKGYSGDIAILIASLLTSGDNESNYGMEFSIVYCDSENLTEPQEVNHAMIEIQYADESVEIVDTTTDIIYTPDQISGWKYNV